MPKTSPPTDPELPDPEADLLESPEADLLESPEADPAAEPQVVSADVDSNADIANLGYEAARDELTDIVSRLESGSVGLEESMVLWQRGEALAKHCTTWLDGAQAKLGN